MGGQGHVYPGVYDLRQLVQEFPEALLFELPALAVAEILDTGLAILRAEVGDTELLRPVHRINDEGRAGTSAYHEIQLLHEHFPRGRRGEPCNVELLCAALRVNEQGVRELRREGRFADTLRAVNHRFNGGVYFSSRNVEIHQNLPLSQVACCGAGCSADFP